MKTQTAPEPLLSAVPPLSAVLPSPDNATESPCEALPIAPLPLSFAPCCVQVEPLRVNTKAAPAPALSLGAPIRDVLPSVDSATEAPCLALADAPLPTSFVPCWVQVPPLRVNTQTAPASPLSV